MSWRMFFTYVAGFYLGANTIYALLYMYWGHNSLQGPNITGYTGWLGDFLRAFFFSVETLSTIGYGHVAPIGLGVNVIVTLEALTSLVSIALMTGLIFARFSRPTAKILYSERAVVAPYQEMTGFMFRCANARNNELNEVSVRILYSRFEPRGTGRQRVFTTLPLEFTKVTFFALSWTVVHPIDADSPLHGRTHEDLIENEAEFMIFLTGVDEVFAQTVYSRTSYKPHEIVWNAKFVPIFVESRELGATGMDLTRIHDIEVLG